jgi:hypothetical protein
MYLIFFRFKKIYSYYTCKNEVKPSTYIRELKIYLALYMTKKKYSTIHAKIEQNLLPNLRLGMDSNLHIKICNLKH